MDNRNSENQKGSSFIEGTTFYFNALALSCKGFFQRYKIDETINTYYETTKNAASQAAKNIDEKYQVRKKFEDIGEQYKVQEKLTSIKSYAIATCTKAAENEYVKSAGEYFKFQSRKQETIQSEEIYALEKIKT
jgi:hypothetical protein